MEPVLSIQPEPLLERLPLRHAPAREAWIATLDEIERRGAGCVAFAPRDAHDAAGQAERDGVLEGLLAHHVSPPGAR